MHISASLTDFSFITALILIGVYIIIDGLYAYYSIQISKRRAIPAATTSGIMHFLLAIGVLNYVHNFLYVIPLAIGSWIGTYLVVQHHHRQESVAMPHLES